MPSVVTLVAAAFAGGIAFGDAAQVRLGPSVAATAVAAALLIAARAGGRWVGPAALLLSAALGLLAEAGARPRRPPGLVGDAACEAEGVVLAAPERAFGSSRIAVDLRTIERDRSVRAARGKVMLLVRGEPAEPLLPGDWVRFPARFRVPRGLINPGGVDSARRAAADGVMATAGLHEPAALSKLARQPEPGVLRLIASWRAHMLVEVKRRLTGDTGTLVASLVLGDRGDIDHALDDAFRLAGVSHVLSVSGLHLAIAAFLFYVGLTKLMLRLPGVGRGACIRRAAAVVALPATIAYTLLTGAQVATVRSCVVAAVCLLGVTVSRRVMLTHALAVAALAILLDAPLLLFDPSFQLSFAAALGTTALTARLTPRVSGQGVARKLLRFGLGLVAASTAAILATAPITAWHFSQFTPAGIFSNLVVVPLAELGVVPVGLGGSVLALLGVPGAGALLHLAGFLAMAMSRFVRWFGGWAPSWRVPAPLLLELAAWYAGLVAGCALRRRGWRWALIGMLGAAASMGARQAWVRVSQRLTANFLDVGQGDACVLELPHGKVAVVDGGGSFDPDFDPGAQVIAPFLWRRGIRRIDLMVLSHPHPDHANGLGFLVDQFPVGEIWTNGQETEQPGTVSLLEKARRRGVWVGSPHRLDLGGAQVRPLHPLDDHGRVAIDAAESENDNSLVVEVVFGERRVLLPGDLEAGGEARLLATSARLHAEVLKVPHHGSRTSSSPGFLDAVHPELAVFSVGDHNRWSFPHPEVLARYRARGARILRTDQDGAVTVTISAVGDIAVRTASQHALAP